MNIVFSICGLGSRFEKDGYKMPKFLIAYNGAPMIYHSVSTLGLRGKIHFIVREEHLLKYKFVEKMLLSIGDEIIICRENTRGAAESLLLCEDHIKDKSLPFVSVNCDQFMNYDYESYNKMILSNPNSCIVPCFNTNSEKCSFARLNENNEIIEIREKKVISNLATVGIYHWSRTEDYFMDAKQMIQEDVRDNNEFYVAPVYNYTLKRGIKVLPFIIEKDHFYPIGTPDDYGEFTYKLKFFD